MVQRDQTGGPCVSLYKRMLYPRVWDISVPHWALSTRLPVTLLDVYQLSVTVPHLITPSRRLRFRRGLLLWAFYYLTLYFVTTIFHSAMELWPPFLLADVVPNNVSGPPIHVTSVFSQPSMIRGDHVCESPIVENSSPFYESQILWPEHQL